MFVGCLRLIIHWPITLPMTPLSAAKGLVPSVADIGSAFTTAGTDSGSPAVLRGDRGIDFVNAVVESRFVSSDVLRSDSISDLNP